jgi:hypothetical protein
LDARGDRDEEVGWWYLRLILVMEECSVILLNPVTKYTENMQSGLASAAIALACVEC